MTTEEALHLIEQIGDVSKCHQRDIAAVMVQLVEDERERCIEWVEVALLHIFDITGEDDGADVKWVFDNLFSMISSGKECPLNNDENQPTTWWAESNKTAEYVQPNPGGQQG